MAQIIVRLKDRELQRMAITAVATRIGRDEGNDVVINNDGISRHHATLRYEAADGAFMIYDASSSNGLYVRGRPAPYARLGDGDEVHLGKFTLVFLASGGVAPEALAPEATASVASMHAPVRDPLPTIAVPVAGRHGGSAVRPAPLRPRSTPIALAPPTPPLEPEEPPPAPQSANDDALAVQARMMRQMMWLLVVLIVVLCALVAALLVR